MEKNWAYAFARLALGLSMFGHGLVRFPKLSGFSSWMTGQFETSFLPPAFVQFFGYALPFAEFIAGLLLILGVKTRWGLIFTGFILLSLILGATLIENWNALPSQLIHLAFVVGLLVYLPHNAFSIDRLISKKQH